MQIYSYMEHPINLKDLSLTITPLDHSISLNH